MTSKREPKRKPGRQPGRNSRQGGASSNFRASLDVVDLAVARSSELKALRAAVSTINGNRRVYQQLSWHARRRTMSHSSRRMPVRLRVAHAAQLAKQRPPGQAEKPPGPRGAARLRKYRKKARFLDAIRKLRAKNPAWLETHVWHAKRFKMGAVGGRKVALNCNDRGFRSAYRATAHASVAHDASYLAMVEVRAEEKTTLKEVVRRRMGFEDGRRATTDPVTEGTRRVTDLMVRDEDGTQIAPVDVLWRPVAEGQLWIWVLPVMKESIEQTFRKQFQGESENACTVSEESHPPLCFTLLGPRTGIVLASVLLPQGDYAHGLKLITQVRSAACLPAACVYSGAASDPRRAFPPKTMGKHNKNVKVITDGFHDAFRSVDDSELWDAERRKKWRDYIIDGVKEVPGGEPVQIPFLLIQKNLNEEHGFASGWDLVIPGGWGMAFWASLMFSNGNRAIGQEELRLLRLEANQPIFPEDFADTISGSMALREDEKNLMAAYLRRPKSKRVNYTLNRIDSPMYPALAKVAEQEWRRVTEDKDSTRPMKRPRSERSAEDVKEDLVRDADIEIIRSQRELRTCLGNAFLSCCPTLRRRGSGRPQKMVAQLPDSLSENTMVLNSKRFTRVVLYAPGKGSPMKNAIICEVDPSDLIAMREKNGNAYTGFRESKAKRGDSAPARDVIGYVTIGGFSLTRGSGIGNGVVSVNSLRRLVGKGAVIPNGRRKGVETGGIIVLFRNVSSLHYRPALIRVVP